MSRRRVPDADTHPTTMSRNGRERSEREMAIARMQTSKEYQDAVKRATDDPDCLERLDALARLTAMDMDFKLAISANASMLQYKHARKEPDPPAPTGRVESYPEEMSPEEWERQFGHNND